MPTTPGAEDALTIPAGFALVPIEPTEAMVAAGWIDKEDVSPRDIYLAMLAAAPTVRAGADTRERIARIVCAAAMSAQVDAEDDVASLVNDRWGAYVDEADAILSFVATHTADSVEAPKRQSDGGQRIIDGLEDAIAWAKGDDSRARLVTLVQWMPEYQAVPGQAYLVSGGVGIKRDGRWYTITGCENPGRPIQWKVSYCAPLLYEPELPTPRPGAEREG